jgi:hypothetical protein
MSTGSHLQKEEGGGNKRKDYVPQYLLYLTSEM